MSRRRMSERQSGMKTSISDFFVSSPYNSDPVIYELLSLVEWESSLSIKRNNTLHRSFQHELQGLKLCMKLELKRPSEGRKEGEQFNGSMVKYIEKYQKIKELFSYCLILEKNEDNLEKSIEKYRDYTKVEKNIKNSLSSYLNEPTIFQMIFNNYLQIYNVNCFTAELIKSTFQLYDQRILAPSAKHRKETESSRTTMLADLQILNKKGVTFKQLIQINEKYSVLSSKLKNKYIFHFLAEAHEELPENIDVKHEAEEKNLNSKLKKIKDLLGKIKSVQGIHSKNKGKEEKRFEDKYSIEMTSEPLEAFYNLNKVSSRKPFFIEEESKTFWSQILFGSLKERKLKMEESSFMFLKKKIIQVEILEHLNAILSYCNVISYIYHEVYPEKTPFYQYTFSSLKKLICAEFLCPHFQSSQVNYEPGDVILSQIQNQRFGFIISDHNTKLLYPSAVYKFLLLIKDLMVLHTINHRYEILLQVLSAKKMYVEKALQTISNLHSLIKGKHYHCYSLLLKYIELLMKNFEFIFFQSSEPSEKNMLENLNEITRKMSIISQIIFQFNSYYDIEPPFKLLVEIEEKHSLTGTFKTSFLYKTILNEIILIRNGLKLDHFYSLNQIHDIFMILPLNCESSTEGSMKKKNYMFFQDIIQALAEISTKNFYLPELFRLFQTQLRLKLAIFRLQICWSCEKDILFDKKHQNFQQFIQDNCNKIFTFVASNPTLNHLIKNIEELERMVSLLEKQVNRIKYVYNLEKMMIAYGVIIPDWRSQLSRQNYLTVESIYMAMNMFNPFMTNKKSMKEELLTEMKHNIENFLTIRLDEMCEWNPFQLIEKQEFAQIFFLVKSFQNSVSLKDCIAVKNLKAGSDEKKQMGVTSQRNIQRMKRQYESSFKCRNLDELKQFYQNLFVLAILHIEEKSPDKKILRSLLCDFKAFDLFVNLDTIDDIQILRTQFHISTKYHHIYEIMSTIDKAARFLFSEEDIFTSQIKSRIKSSEKTIKTEKGIQGKEKNKEERKFQLIEKYFLIGNLGEETRLQVFQKIEEIFYEVSTKVPVVIDYEKYTKNLNQKIFSFLITKIKQKIVSNKLEKQIPLDLLNFSSPQENVLSLKSKMIQCISEEFSMGNQNFLGERSEIQLFNEKIGYQLKIIDQNKHKNYKITNRKLKNERNKKAVISPQKLQRNTLMLLEEIKRTAIIQIIKETIPVRKNIAELQLQGRKMRNQITWETSRLENQVVDKIHHFIAMSSIDQEQSYNRFKHTVSMETIKGIENVIAEQTNAYSEKQNQEVKEKDEDDSLFMTQVVSKEVIQEEPKENRSLNLNLDEILSHMKKIRVFSSWKQLIKESDDHSKEWVLFDENVEKILHNEEVISSIKNINLIREHCLNQKVFCSLLKEQNSLVNERIKKIKFEKIGIILDEYRKQLCS